MEDDAPPEILNGPFHLSPAMAGSRLIQLIGLKSERNGCILDKDCDWAQY